MTFGDFMLTNCDYQIKTTFWDDFSIADIFGVTAIKDTFQRALNEWKNNCVFLTELVLVLNHKLWAYYEKNDEYFKLYTELYNKANNYALDNLKDNEFSYFFRITD